MSADRPGPRRLAEDQGVPGDFLVGFTRGLMDRREQLLRDGQPPAAARESAVAEAVQAFAAGVDQRGWTVGERRIASLADDTLGLEEEYRDQHGYEPELARLFAVGEVLEGERAREEVPLPWRSEADPSQRPTPATSGTNCPSGHGRTAARTGSGRGRTAMNADQPDPRLNGDRGVRPDGHPDGPVSNPGVWWPGGCPGWTGSPCS